MVANCPVSSSVLSSIELLVMDVDGVLTTGGITYTAGGEEVKTFDVKDGHGLALWHHYGMRSAIITGRQSSIVEKRASELKIPYVFQGCKNKLPTLEALCEQLNLSLEQVCYIGDDWPDLKCIQAVGLGVCPSDAVEEVRHASDWVLSLPGGHGAVRELLNALIAARGFELK